MLNSAVRPAALIAILALATSCSDARLPTPPTAATLPTPPVPVPPVPPSPFAGSGTYEFVPSPGKSVEPYTLESRYVLHDDGKFTLQLPRIGLPGRYREAGGIVTFDFEWNNQIAGAKGVFSGDAMTVTYNLDMSMSDFESGVYVKRP